MKIVIVGAGIHGLALAWALVRSGHQVTVIERGPIPNPGNASYDQHRLIHDFNRSDDDPPLDQAFAAWRTLSHDIGPLYVETGTVCGFADTDAANATLESLRSSGVEGRLLDMRGVAGLLPDLRLDLRQCAVMTRRGGILLADQIAILLTLWLEQAGVRLRPGATVRQIDPDKPAAILGDGEAVTGDRLIACAGAFTAGLLPQLADTIGAKRQILAYLEPPQHLQAAWQRAPVFVNWGGPDDLWGAPSAAGTHVKLAVGRFARAGRPENPDSGSVTSDEIAALLDRFRPRMPQLGAYRMIRASACFYSAAPGGRMMTRPLDDRGRSWVVAGHNGSDYKFAPALALDLAARLSHRVS